MSMEEELEEREGEEELFYESLDCILSSFASSTSASDDDGTADRPRRRRLACDAAVAAALDLWTSQSASVQERRRWLLHLMGLAGDPSLTRSGTGRSAPDDTAAPPPASLIDRSRSDGATPGSAGRPPLGGGPLRSSLSNVSDAALEAVDEDDPRCLIRNLDDGSEFMGREEFCLRRSARGGSSAWRSSSSSTAAAAAQGAKLARGPEREEERGGKVSPEKGGSSMSMVTAVD